MIYLKVREIAEAKGISQGQLSRRSDIALKTINLIFNNREMSISLHTLNRLARALNVDARDLIEYVRDQE